MKYRMKFFIAAFQKKPRQFSKFDSIAEIPFYQLPIERAFLQQKHIDDTIDFDQISTSNFCSLIFYCELDHDGMPILILI
jgi:hypothetical protein